MWVRARPVARAMDAKCTLITAPACLFQTCGSRAYAYSILLEAALKVVHTLLTSERIA